MQSKFLHFAIIPLLFALSIACSSSQKKDTESQLPRIAIAGIAIESSTFSPAVTHEEAFMARYGDDVFTYYPFLDADSSLRQKANWLPTMRGHAMPGGIVTREAYESLVKQTLERLEQVLPLDGIFLDIHGAMSVVGLDDPEGDFIVRIRELVGTDVMISTCMDLHGSVSWRLAQNTDLITCFRMAPHEDALISKQRAVENLLQRLENDKGKPPYKAWVPVPILLPWRKDQHPRRTGQKPLCHD
jgi:microcystin degradation protein MlrC